VLLHPKDPGRVHQCQPGPVTDGMVVSMCAFESLGLGSVSLADEDFAINDGRWNLGCAECAWDAALNLFKKVCTAAESPDKRFKILPERVHKRICGGLFRGRSCQILHQDHAGRLVDQRLATLGGMHATHGRRSSKRFVKYEIIHLDDIGMLNFLLHERV